MDEMHKTIFDINYDQLIKNGKQCFIYDFDNTLNRWRESHVDQPIIELFKKLNSKGVKILIVSNGHPRKLEIDVECIWLARKPFAFKVRKWLKNNNIDPKTVVVIGDQLFTDVLFGKFIKAYTIKVEPLDKKHEFWGTKILRFFEKLVLKMLKAMV
ncbi:YqeG family HAD IIIA-type phosphatase [Thermosipho ferrireducens]|uniref:YqeG family HAD IIIA-type phosphatase n=1 Tax=Thermosipho ferrireducens TaxID=2571116 RepID=A0ABX7S6L0_9BACT|nr:YqeG family HAD IIIA-type phosphatase [Thermosipho ferrireducens]QTA37390.1 YqeG family HAD IIIA-type phosphatase [Thermosipho ferrireducens]